LARLLAHHRGGNQGSSSGDRGRVCGKGCEHPLAPCTRIRRARRPPGVPEDVDDLRSGEPLTVGDRELERLTDVGVLFADPDGRFVLRDEELHERLAGEVPDPSQVTLVQRIAFPGLTESLGSVLTDGFEEPKTRPGTSEDPRQ
jgi:hypothetical protein